MEGNQFFTINPGTFTDPNSWSYADLRTLSKDLGLGGNGKRCQLESRLTNWHRARTDASHNLVPLVDEANEEDLPMNVEGSNFSVLPIALEPRDVDGFDSKRRRRSSFLTIEVDKENHTLVSPCLLRPLRHNEEGTPGKSILKINCKEKSPVPPNKLPNITFSPFNAVRVIPHRSTTFPDETEYNMGQPQPHEDEDEIEEDEDDEEDNEDDDDDEEEEEEEEEEEGEEEVEMKDSDSDDSF